MKILLTGFGSFLTVKENVTEKIIVDIERSWNKKDGELRSVVMPVAWDPVRFILGSEIISFKPDIIIGMGHAEGYEAFTIETRYSNVMEDLVKGKLSPIRKIEECGPELYYSNINAGALVAQLRQCGIPAVSNEEIQKTKYLCNFVGYIAAHQVRMQGLRSRFLFIHVPPPKDLNYEVSLLGAQETVRFLLKQ